jgi:glycosyltransferase involved in cell wall biosynthesis
MVFMNRLRQLVHSRSDGTHWFTGPSRGGTGLLVVVLPALNEAATISTVIARIPRAMPGVRAIEVVVVDDGSTDATADLARRAGATVVSHPANLGVGAAVATGLDVALSMGAEIIVHLDSDGQFDATDIPQLVRLIQEEGFGLATGTRYADKALIPDMPWINKAGGMAMSRLVNMVISGARFTDVTCGFRAYSRDAAMKLVLFSTFTYTQESLIDLASKGVRIAEIPLRIRGVREHGTSRVAGNLWAYGAKTMAIILRALRDKRPLTFFGIPALMLLVLGLLAGAGAMSSWLLMPHPSVLPWILLAMSFCLLQVGAVVTAVALIADQVARLRIIQEKALFLQRKHDYGQVPVPIVGTCSSGLVGTKLHTPGPMVGVE